ncbi:MAG TPA: HD domain-containing phosphohydrolase [Chloroflexota bacterium]|nr:HD domain-containing phosphohydrolase [Chloroflexota bacterium]
MTPPVFAPARGPRLPRISSWAEAAGDGHAPAPDPASLQAGGPYEAAGAMDLPCPDLLTVWDWSVAISASRDLPDLVPRVGQCVERLGARAAVIFPWDPAARALRSGGSSGTEAPEGLASLACGALSAAIVAAGRPRAVPDVEDLPAADPDRAAARALGWRALAGLPLRLGDEPVGLLYVAWVTPRQITARERTLLTLLAQHVAVSLANASILAESRVRAEALERAEQQMVAYARDLREVYERERARRAEVQQAYITTVRVLAAAIETRDAYTGGHVERVAEYSVAIGRELGWDEDQLMTLELGALLHDVGKIGVDDGVLRKPAKLEPDEWAHMQRHPELGAHMLRDVPFLQASLSCVLYHHERFDGAGYPHRLAGTAIPLEARIVSVADTFDAMTSDRPYRKGLPASVALEEIARCAGSQFDPLVVRAFLRVVEAPPLVSLPGA